MSAAAPSGVAAAPISWGVCEGPTGEVELLISEREAVVDA